MRQLTGSTLPLPRVRPRLPRHGTASRSGKLPARAPAHSRGSRPGPGFAIGNLGNRPDLRASGDGGRNRRAGCPSGMHGCGDAWLRRVGARPQGQAPGRDPPRNPGLFRRHRRSSRSGAPPAPRHGGAHPRFPPSCSCICPCAPGRSGGRFPPATGGGAGNAQATTMRSGWPGCRSLRARRGFCLSCRCPRALRRSCFSRRVRRHGRAYGLGRARSPARPLAGTTATTRAVALASSRRRLRLVVALLAGSPRQPALYQT